MQASATVAATVNSVHITWSVSEAGLAPGSDWGATVLAELTDVRDKEAVGSEEPRCLAAVAGSDGTARAEGVSSFHFLCPRRRYSFVLALAGDTGKPPLLTQAAETEQCGRGLPRQLAYRIPPEMWPKFVGPEHELGEWLAKCPEDIVWCFQPEYAQLRQLWLNACFTLPSPESPITTCPNPSNRYCLDLTEQAKWLASKKVRRFKKDFELTINKDFAGTFRRCRDSHSSRDEGCWITESLVEALDRCRREAGQIKVYAVELWEKSSGKLAACIMSFSVGDIFHDYSMATFIRDDRSAGKVLTKVLGHLLMKSGYTLWYWGFKNPYMAEFDEPYGGSEISNVDFWPRWKAAKAAVATFDVVSALPGGPDSVLDLATL